MSLFVEKRSNTFCSINVAGGARVSRKLRVGVLICIPNWATKPRNCIKLCPSVGVVISCDINELITSPRCNLQCKCWCKFGYKLTVVGKFLVRPQLALSGSHSRVNNKFSFGSFAAHVRPGSRYSAVQQIAATNQYWFSVPTISATGHKQPHASYDP